MLSDYGMKISQRFQYARHVILTMTHKAKYWPIFACFCFVFPYSMGKTKENCYYLGQTSNVGCINWYNSGRSVEVPLHCTVEKMLSATKDQSERSK